MDVFSVVRIQELKSRTVIKKLLVNNWRPDPEKLTAYFCFQNISTLVSNGDVMHAWNSQLVGKGIRRSAKGPKTEHPRGASTVGLRLEERHHQCVSLHFQTKPTRTTWTNPYCRSDFDHMMRRPFTDMRKWGSSWSSEAVSTLRHVRGGATIRQSSQSEKRYQQRPPSGPIASDRIFLQLVRLALARSLGWALSIAVYLAKSSSHQHFRKLLPPLFSSPQVFVNNYNRTISAGF